MNKHKLVETLRQHKNRVEAQSAALEFLGPDAKMWWEYRQKVGQNRIVNEKTLEMASEFQANGKTYYILRPEDGINVFRMSQLKQMLSLAYTDLNFSEQMQFVSKVIALFNRIGTKDFNPKMIFEVLSQEKKRLEGVRDRKWDYALNACAFFIVTPDEDLTKFTPQDAERKKEDWAKEGIPHEDFFLCAMLWGKLLTERKNKLQQKVDQVAKRKVPQQRDS